jgi:long-chain acyl-CoA synthetase
MTQAAAAPTPSIPWPAMSVKQAYAMITAPGSPGEMEEIDIRGVNTRVWKNCPPTLRDTLQLGRAHGEKIFMVHEDERVSFEAFYRAVTVFAAELEAAGVKKGDRIALVMRNLPEWPVAFYAGLTLGAIMTPLNAWWTGQELEYGLIDSGASVAIMDVERYERLHEHFDHCPELMLVYVSRAKEEISHPYVRRIEKVIGCPNDWIGLEEQPLSTVELGPEDDATIFYTSGTTGKPKGVLATHRAVQQQHLRRRRRRGPQLPAPRRGPAPARSGACRRRALC